MSAARRNSLAFTVVVTVAVVLGALLTLLVLALSGAPGITLLATALAALPVGPVLAAYLWLDRYEPEPRALLAAGLAWGAFVATMAAIVVQGLGGLFVGVGDTSSLAVVAPVTEEASKGLFLVLLLWWRRAEVDGILDGIVYAGMVGVGFAFTENILYLASAWNGTDGMGPGGFEAVTGTFVVRCIFSPFAHPLFTAFTGIGIGLAVASRRPAVRWLAPVGGYLLAVLAHATWNGSTVFGFGGFAVVYVVIMAPAFVGMIALAWWARETEAHVLRVALTDAAQRGLLPATDIGWVVDLRARRHARRHARQAGGAVAEQAMRDYQQAAIELGFLHHRLLRGTAPADWQVRGQDFLGRIQTARPRIAFPGQVVPQR
ncbi:PrsW family intramembrane metalloprotease [Nocardioides daeguensis]|uniref:PrsW family intramembrane metalloprotease n=1 Tax=Nocardioides daeguensis TaxID=908359 RepID=A0ABP6UU29_9ACTN|nr:PrsW family intramembrane metalloprotease [Nocardioides daeguensis]MBV6729225.1 PrsW family intramembrane metalloprotease [Nocardioides daeguensis]MCR1774792.1 PrsW family intramembrane metalloprotease [Nocardioides daeguensis]